MTPFTSYTTNILQSPSRHETFIQFYIELPFYHGNPKIMEFGIMQIEEQNSVKAQQDVKRQHISNLTNREKVQNVYDDQNAGYVELSSEQSQQKENTYKRQRDQMSEKNVKPIDLNKEIFSGIVRLCRDNNLIDEELAHCFFTNHTTRLQTLYIQCYKTNQLHRYDFSKSKINIIDHRRLVRMLLQDNPEKYIAIKPQGPYDYLKEAREFLKEIYTLSVEDYEQLLQAQVNKYYQSWWGGPENLNPLPIDPLVKILDPEETKRILEQRQNAARSQRMQEQKQRGKKANQNTDLIEIAKYLSSQLFGNKEVKFQEQEEQKDREEQSVASKRKKKKNEKDKKEKDKKSKKKHKKDQQIKQEDIQPKFQPDDSIQEINGTKKKKQG